MNRRWTEHLVVLSAYTLLALGLTYPLVLHFGNTIPAVPGDVWSYVWAMGWARVSSLDLGVNPFRTDFVYYPLGGATQLLWATALPSFASLPLQLAFGLIPAFNLMYLAATVLTAYGMYLLARYVNAECRSQPSTNWNCFGIEFIPDPASFIAGLAFAFCALRLGYGLAFTNLYHTELIPFYILFLLKSERGWRNVFLAGILLGLNAYIDFQIAAFLVLFTALWFVVRLIQRISPIRDLVRRGVMVSVVAGLVAAPMMAIVAQDMAIEGGNYIRVYPLKYSTERSYDVLSYVLPNARSSLYQALPAPRVTGVNAAVNVEGESQFSPDRQAFLGLTVLALACIGAVRRPRQLALWIVATLFFALLSFGPTPHVAGQDLGIPLPYTLIHEVPILNNIRIPMRYGLMAFLGAAVLAGAGVSVLAARLQPAPLVGILTVLVLGESAVLPYPMLDFSVPRVYETIAAEPGNFTILEIPSFNWRDAAMSEVYQTVHHKHILRAYTNRIAPELADYFGQRQMPIVTRSLRVLEGAGEGGFSMDDLPEDRQILSDTLHFFSLRYAVLHRDWLDANQAGLVDKYLREVLGAHEIFNDGAVRAYEFVPTRAEPNRTLDLSSNTALMYLGRGWQTEPLAEIEGKTGRYLKGEVSELYFENIAGEIDWRAFSEKSGVVLKCELNGQFLSPLTFKAGWADYKLVLPAEAVQPAMNTMRCSHPASVENRIAISSIDIR